MRFRLPGYMSFFSLLGLCLGFCGSLHAETFRLQNGNVELQADHDNIIVRNNKATLLKLESFSFNYEQLDSWEISQKDDGSLLISANLPASVDFYRTAYDEKARQVNIAITKVSGGFRLHAAPEWGRQTTLEFAWLGDHFFGLSAPLQPDNRLSPDLTGATINVDINSEGAAFRENYATAYSAFFMSSAGYGGFFDTFARGRYEFAINKKTRIHHDTGVLDWYIFTGDNGTEIHQHYFDLIGEPKFVPVWALGPVGWRDQNDGGAAEILEDIDRLSELAMPFTSWFVDRPYSDGAHAWSKMNWSEKFANPEAWIKRIRDDYGLEFMTWVATSTFGDARFEKHLGGRFSYIDLSHPASVQAYKNELKQNQYAHGVRGHKIDRADEVFPEYEEWFDGTPIPERRNKYSWLVAKHHHDALADAWEKDQVTFMRSAWHRTQPYLSAIWGGDPRTTWDGLQGNFANAMRSSFMGFPVWGTDVGGYQGEGYIPEDLYIRWMQAGSMTGLFEIKLDGAGGDGRDRMPWQYDEKFQTLFRDILDDRMRFLPHLFALANNSAQSGVLMQPMAYQHLRDKNTWAMWDQFYLGDNLLVAPMFNADKGRNIYFPKGEWRNFDKPTETIKGGKTRFVEVALDRLPRYMRENAIILHAELHDELQDEHARKGKLLWQADASTTRVLLNPAPKKGESEFTFVDMQTQQKQAIRLRAQSSRIEAEIPASEQLTSAEIFLSKAPKQVSLNGKTLSVHFDSQRSSVIVPLDKSSNNSLLILR